jgi:S1-C subfamily serine protease
MIDWSDLLKNIDLNTWFDNTSHVPKQFQSQGSLLKYLSMTQAELDVIAKFRGRMYLSFLTPKKSGGNRQISAPNKRLKYLQRLLLPVLETMYRPRIVVNGFCKDRSAITNAKAHRGRRHVVNIDLKDFFPSISEIRVKNLLIAIGVHRDVANTICILCCWKHGLPQGAPTSPILSNMICLKLDLQISKFCKANRIRFTRYADDLSFSTFGNPAALFDEMPLAAGKFDLEFLASSIETAITKNGFEINEEKLRYFNERSRREVTGIIINQKLNVRRSFVRNIRSALYEAESKGYDVAQEKFQSITKSDRSLKEVLRGRIAWIGQVKGISDGVYRNYATRFNRFFHEDMKIGPSFEEIQDHSVWVVEVEFPSGHPDVCAQGTCFFLNGYGLVTANHCVEGAKKIEVFRVDNQSSKYPATVKRFDAHRDLAILDHGIPQDKFHSLDVTDTPIIRGDEIVCLGFPDFGNGDKLTVSPGSVISRPKKHGVEQISVSQLIVPGNSGGPLLSNSSRVVGIAHKGGPGEPRNLAISIDELVTWSTEP